MILFSLVCLQLWSLSTNHFLLALDDEPGLLLKGDRAPDSDCNYLSDASGEGKCDSPEPPAWEYVPRVWTPEEGDTLEHQDQYYPEVLRHEDAGSGAPSDLANQKEESESLSRKAIREKSHFYEANIKRLFGANRANFNKWKTRQQQQEEGDQCDQFRVDIRETVICDRHRCDKLDFEWPKYDNQMVVVQTTKAGMRFYQAHLEFEAPRWSDTKEWRLNNRIQNITSSKELKVPIKFDILDLFKPKPKPTQPTTTTPEATSETPTKTATPSDINPTPTDQFGIPNVTPANNRPGGTQLPPPPSRAIDAQDNNKTQLVTTFRLDTRRRVQRIVGFGGALSDSSCRNVKSLSPTMAKNLMEDYFGARGLQYTIVRMSMGSSDFSTTPYTNNDKPYDKSKVMMGSDRRDSLNETDDVEMKYFHLTEEDYEYKLPVARQAIATSKRPLKFFSSLWSPPIWMKNNSHIVHGYLKGDVYGPYYKALAELIVRWLEAYRKQGIEFWATTGLNEPITGIRPFIFHNSLGITRDDYITWIKLYLGPMLKQRGFNDTKLIAVDDNKGYMPNWAGGLLEDEEVAKYVSGIAVHWYMNDDYENLNFLIQKHPDKFILSTEACNGYYPFQVHVLPGDWDRGVAYMYDIMRLMHKNAVGWVDWNMALNVYGGPSWPGNYIDSPVLVNADRDEYYKSPTFYAIGHYSRFVPPDSYRLDHRLANARYDYPLEASGFYTPDDYVVIVVLNANKHQVPFRVIVDRQQVRIVNLKEESFNTIVFKWRRRLS